ncbi:MAG: hypothetical protein ACJ71B_06020 [Nitrososphaera sp.]
MEVATQIDVGADLIVNSVLAIVLGFVGNVLLGISIGRSRTLPKWAGAIWVAWAAMFYMAGVLYGFLLKGSSPPTQPLGSLLMSISGGWIAWSAFRQSPPPSPALKQQEA